jgi:hypothetical protein
MISLGLRHLTLARLAWRSIAFQCAERCHAALRCGNRTGSGIEEAEGPGQADGLRTADRGWPTKRARTIP